MTASLGFLSVRKHREHGYFGGYLITNSNARPLEFHCTMPVRPSRAQELLYGPTLDAFVCGEQIAKALTMKAKLKPNVLLTDCAAVLAISSVSDISAALLEFDSVSEPPSPHFISPTAKWNCLRSIAIDKWQFSVATEAKTTEASLRELVSSLATNFDLTEPFQRITEALLEAHPIAKAA